MVNLNLRRRPRPLRTSLLLYGLSLMVTERRVTSTGGGGGEEEVGLDSIGSLCTVPHKLLLFVAKEKIESLIFCPHSKPVITAFHPRPTVIRFLSSLY